MSSGDYSLGPVSDPQASSLSDQPANQPFDLASGVDQQFNVINDLIGSDDSGVDQGIEDEDGSEDDADHDDDGRGHSDGPDPFTHSMERQGLNDLKYPKHMVRDIALTLIKNYHDNDTSFDDDVGLTLLETTPLQRTMLAFMKQLGCDGKPYSSSLRMAVHVANGDTLDNPQHPFSLDTLATSYEAEAIVIFVQRLMEFDPPAPEIEDTPTFRRIEAGDIGISTPFASQAALIQEILLECGVRGIKVLMNEAVRDQEYRIHLISFVSDPHQSIKSLTFIASEQHHVHIWRATEFQLTFADFKEWEIASFSDSTSAPSRWLARQPFYEWVKYLRVHKEIISWDNFVVWRDKSKRSMTGYPKIRMSKMKRGMRRQFWQLNESEGAS